MRVAEIEAPTALVETLKVAVVLPVGTVTVAGTTAAALPLVSETDTPPNGADPLRVIVPVAELPPAMLVGFTETEESDTPTFVESGIVTVEPAAIATLSCTCPP